MEESIKDNIGEAIKNWWIYLVMGIVLLIGGGVMSASPVWAAAFLAYIMAIYFVITGIFEIIFSITNRQFEGWGWRLFMGVFHLLIGGYLLKNPMLQGLFLGFLVSFWLLFYGAGLASFSLEIRKIRGSGWVLWLIIGVLAILSASFLLLFNPFGAATGFALFMGINSIILGVFTIWGSFQLRRLKKSSTIVDEQ